MVRKNKSSFVYTKKFHILYRSAFRKSSVFYINQGIARVKFYNICTSMTHISSVSETSLISLLFCFPPRAGTSRPFPIFPWATGPMTEVRSLPDCWHTHPIRYQSQTQSPPSAHHLPHNDHFVTVIESERTIHQIEQFVSSTTCGPVGVAPGGPKRSDGMFVCGFW